MEPSSASPIINEVERLWAGMIAAARARDPDGIEAAYATTPVVAINGTILPDYHAHFAGVRSWLRALQSMDARYDDVHVEVLAADVVVATMLHHLAWTDASGAQPVRPSPHPQQRGFRVQARVRARGSGEDSRAADRG